MVLHKVVPEWKLDAIQLQSNPVYRYFSVRYKPYFFIPGFFGNCSVFFDISLLVHSVINLEFFHNCVSFCHQNITKESENMFERRVVQLMKMSVCHLLKSVIGRLAFCQLRSVFSTVVPNKYFTKGSNSVDSYQVQNITCYIFLQLNNAMIYMLCRNLD